MFNDKEYTYGNSGLRTSKVVNTQATDFVNDGSNIVYEKKYDTATPETISTATYIRGINLICKIEARAKYFYLYNGHGDVIQIVDNLGNVVNNYNYDEWGNILEENETIQNPFKYAGEYFDNETGYIYLRARYYDTVIGRFINEDTFLGNNDDPLSLNLYTYCANNPIIYVDPSGNKYIIDDIYYGLVARKDAMCNKPSLYNVGNWLTMGLFDSVKGAVNPEKPLSLQHWIDSATVVFTVYGAYKIVKIPSVYGQDLTKNGPSKAFVDSFKSHIDDCMSKTGTVWDDIILTQDMYPNTKIPKSFELSVGSENFWVHPNATKHMVEYVTKSTTHGMPVNSQTLLTSFKESVSGALKQGINYEKIINIGSWELIFSKPKLEGLLPVIKHAVFRP